MIETWLKFDISGIPPQATISSATLTATLDYAHVYANVGAYYASSNSWSQSSITWNNAPLSSISGTPASSNYVTNSTLNYSWGVGSVVAASVPTQTRLTLVLGSTSSESSDVNGWIEFVATSMHLNIVYTYASTSLSISASPIQYGTSVTVKGTTDPPQSQGTIQLEYSKDQSSWFTIQSQNGGSATSSWTPPSAGTFYLRSVWQISWNGGADSYAATSSISTLVVNPAPSKVQLTLTQSIITLGKTVTITANITPTSASDGTVTIQYSTDGTSWAALNSGTPTSGMFSYVWSPSNYGTYYLRAVWTGDTDYRGSTSNQLTLTVEHIPTSISLTYPSTTRLDQSISITATLKDNANNPIGGAQITFQLNSSPIGTAITNGEGSATLVYTISVSAGTYTITASYAGSSQYAPSTSQTQITIVPWTLLISTAVPNAYLISFNGQNYVSDATGKVTILVHSTGSYSLSVISPVVTSPGTRVVFVQWGDGSTSMSKAIYIGSDTTLSLTTKTQYLLTLQSQYSNPSGGGWYDSGTNAQLSMKSPVDQGNGTRRVFSTWAMGSQTYLTSPSGTVDMTGPVTLQAVWVKQYYLNMITQYGNPSGTGWYDVGSMVKVSVQSPFQTTNSTRYVLLDFTGTGSAPHSGTSASTSFDINTPSSLTFDWQTQYLVSVENAGSGVSVSGAGWYSANATATIQISPTVLGILVQQVFAGWQEGRSSQGGVSTFTVNGPISLHAVWKTDYTQLIVLIAAVGGSGAVGGFAWRKRKGGQKLVRQLPKEPREPQQKESPFSTQKTVREQKEQLETGTSVYAAYPCRTCGTINPVGAIYCANCGSALEPQKN